MRSYRLLGTVLLVVLAFLAACGDDDTTLVADDGTTDEGEPATIDGEALTASTWVLRSGGGPDGAVPIVDGWPITITFTSDGTVGGTAACNGYGGAYTIAGSQLAIDGLGSTDMACAPEVQASEAAYLAALTGVDGIDLTTEELALSGPATELIFAATEPAPIDDLVGQIWLLDALLAGGEETPVEGRPASLLIGADGSFTGSTGCRSLQGRYVVTGNEILFNEMAADGDCPASLFGQDSVVVTVLGDGFVPMIDGDTLTLSSVGNEGLRYRAISEDELEAETGTPVASDADLLAGIEWVFTGGDSPDGPIVEPSAIDPAARITLTIDGEVYGGTVICNTYGGEAEIGDSLWNVGFGVPSATEEGCGDDLDAIAAAYLAALPQMGEGGIEADGRRLVMNGNEIELHFERAG